MANSLVSETKAEEKNKKTRLLRKIRRNLKKRKNKRGDGCPEILTNGKRAGQRCNRRLHRLRNGNYSNLCKYHHGRQQLEQRIATKYLKMDNLPPPPPTISLSNFPDVPKTPLSPPTIPPPPINESITAPMATTPIAAGSSDAGAPATANDPMTDSEFFGGVTEDEFNKLIGSSDEKERKRREFDEKEAQRLKEEEERLTAECLELTRKRLEALKSHR